MTPPGRSTSKRISLSAYQAVSGALLAGLNFRDLKRYVAGQLGDGWHKALRTSSRDSSLHG